MPIVRRTGQTIKDVRISAGRWNRKHWGSIDSSYTSAPFFEQYGGELKELLDRPPERLCELNARLTAWVMAALNIGTPTIDASELGVKGSGTELLVSICKELAATHYLSGPGGQRYMDMMAFERENLRVVWQRFTSPHYQQVFPEIGFIPDLSVIDALFSEGPGTEDLLALE